MSIDCNKRLLWQDVRDLWYKLACCRSHTAADAAEAWSMHTNQLGIKVLEGSDRSGKSDSVKVQHASL